MRIWRGIAFRGLLAVLPLLVGASPLAAQEESKQDEPSKDPIEEIDQRLRILERKDELDREKAAENAKQTPSVGTGKDGFFFKSADGDNVLRIRGYVQFDGRSYQHDQKKPATDTFILRRVRPVFEGTVGRIFDFKIMPDFGGGTTVLYDAYLDIRFSPAAKLRVGKYKPPVGLERLQSATDIVFVERALPTNLVPNRDLGLQFHGEVAKGAFGYALGVFNGVPDGANADLDTNSGKDFATRFFAQPWKNGTHDAVRELGFGIAGSYGINRGTASATGLPSYRTAGQQAFFSYRSDATAAGTVVGDGERQRVSPQAYWYAGRFGALAEYVVSSQEVRLVTGSARIRNDAWQTTLSVLLTDDKAGYKAVSPKKPFDQAKGGRGALELAARYGELEIGDEAFPIFANPDASARRAQEWGFGVNWYLTRNVRICLDYVETRFDGGAPGGTDREQEKLLNSRFQISF